MSKTMISTRIADKLGEDLAAMAEVTRRSKAFLVNEAIEDYVKRHSWIIKRIDQAVKAADASDEYVSEEDMEAWLLSWGSENELPPPPLRKRGT